MDALRTGLFAAFVVGLGLSITLSQSALVALTVLWLWRLRDPDARRTQAWPLWAPVLVFCAATLVSALASGHPAESLKASKSLLLMAALFVTADALTSAARARRFLSWFAVVATIAAVWGLLQVGTCSSGMAPTAARWGQRWLHHKCDRAHGPFSIYMTLAGVLNLALLSTLPRLLPGAARARWHVVAWLVTLAGLIATYTRGAWLGFGAGVIALLPASRRGRLALVLGLAAIVAVVLVGPAGIRHRFLSMGNPDDPTVRERWYMWQSATAMFRERPLLGFGPGGVKREYGAYAIPTAVKRHTSHVHNTPLQVLVERGLIGLAAWLAIWIGFYVRAIGLLRRLPSEATTARTVVLGSLAAITGFLVGGLTEYNFGDSEVVMVAWAVTALPWIVSRDAGEPEVAPAERRSAVRLST